MVALAAAGTTEQTKAQVVPNAGAAIRDIEREPIKLPPRQHLDLNLPDDGAQPVQVSGAQHIAVKVFHVSGNTKIDDTTLLALLADLTGREVTIAQLREGASRITRLYRKRGYPLTRAWLPRQEITDGVVRIEVIEGRFGEVRVQNQANLKAIALAPLKQLEPGAVVQADTLERSLLLMRERSGVSVKSTLQPGASVGTTDLLVEATLEPWLQGSLEIDNYGNHYTGEYRLGASLDMRNLLGLGDQLSLRVLGTNEHQIYGRVDWQSGGLGASGTQVGLSYSQVHYALGKDFEALDATGSARIASLWVAQPLIRSRAFALTAAMQFDDKDLQDDIGLFASENPKHAQVVQVRLSGNGSDDWLRGGVSSFNLAWSSGQLHLGDAGYRANDATTAHTQGHFQKINASVARLQRLSQLFSLYGSIEGQWANRNLDNSEKLSLGGAYGVRAYPQGEASGDRGWLGSLELRYAVKSDWQLAAFIDHGEVRINSIPWALGRNYQRLSGTGLGVYWTRGAWRAQATVAWQLNAADVTRGPEHTPRVWVQVGRQF